MKSQNLTLNPPIIQPADSRYYCVGGFAHLYLISHTVEVPQACQLAHWVWNYCLGHHTFVDQLSCVIVSLLALQATLAFGCHVPRQIPTHKQHHYMKKIKSAVSECINHLILIRWLNDQR